MYVFTDIVRLAVARVGVLATAGFLAVAPAAVAQTTKTLTVAKDASIRGGSYASVNSGSSSTLASRASDDATYERRAVLTFDTETTIPDGAPIQSAKLVLTVKGGNAEARTLGAYTIPLSFDEGSVNWKVRKSGISWSYAGGDVAGTYVTARVTNTAGSTVTFDVTAAVQKVVNGTYGSRYARFLVMDTGGSSRDSYKEYHAREASDSAKRPRLVVTYGSGASSSGTPDPAASDSEPAASGTRLRVLQWNTHHGVGTDGRYDINRIATWIVKMQPDVVMLNEVEKYTGWGNEDQPARYEALLESKTGRRWYAHFAQEFGNWASNGKGHLILSVYPLDSVARVEITPSDGLNGAGAAALAGITVNGRRVNLVVTHLDPYSKTMRLIQARDAIAWASGFAENRILGGDMNAWPDQSSIAEFNKTYRDSWTVAASKGKAIGFSGLSPEGATKKGRIDYIFYSARATNLTVVQSQVYDTRDANGYKPSDHRPVLTTFDVK